MKSLSAALAFAICAGASPGVPTSNRVTGPRADTLHVLLIGNSYLYYNNTPAILEAVARSSGGPTITTRLVAHGGWTLEDHLGDSTTLRTLSERRWDWVVVNEQSLLGDLYFVDGVPRIHSAKRFAASATRLAAEVKARGGKLLIVGHWSRKDAAPRDTAALAFLLDSVARALKVDLIPVNAAWVSPELQPIRTKLYDADGSHPAPMGSYLLANVIYASLANRAPGGAPTSIRGARIELQDGVVHPENAVTLVELRREVAQQLQRAAWEAVQRSKAPKRTARTTRLVPLTLPKLPREREPLAAARLQGTWRGSTTLYPGTTPSALELKIVGMSNALRGTLTLRPNTPGASPTALDVVMRGDSLTFVDPNGPNGGSVVYHGVLSRGLLKGIAEFVVPVPWLYGIGSWQLTKHSDKA